MIPYEFFGVFFYLINCEYPVDRSRAEDEGSSKLKSIYGFSTWLAEI
jgi:hypothetical protein